MQLRALVICPIYACCKIAIASLSKEKKRIYHQSLVRTILDLIIAVHHTWL